MENNKMKKTHKGFLGYGFGYVGQGTAYSFVSTYIILYMTNIVGLSSAIAGFITSMALLTEVIAGMIVGNVSDACQSRLGKRRPFILAAAITMPFIMIGLFTSVGGTASVKAAYYLLFSILFRISFVCFEITAGAFGAEIARDYDARIRLRTYARTFGIFGNLIAYVAPLWIIDWFDDKVLGWRVIGCVIGVIVCAGFYACFALTKDFSAVDAPDKARGEKGRALRKIIVNYGQLLKLKTMKILIVYKAGFSCAFALYTVCTIYYMRYSLGLDNQYTSYIYFYAVTVFLISTPLINRTALKIGKSNQQKYMMAISSVLGMVIYWLGANSIGSAVAYITVFSVMQTSFWQLSSSIFYDIVEVDEFLNGKRREGDIMSFVSVFGTFITAAMVQLFGLLLNSSGYDPLLLVQNSHVVSFLNIAFILAPSICFGIGSLALMAFPLNKKSFGSLTEAVKLKKAGEDYSQYMEDLQKIL